MTLRIFAPLFVLALISLNSAQSFACAQKCINISGNPGYDQTCRNAGQLGQCDDQVFRGTCQTGTGSVQCVNVSGNSGYDQTCRNAGQLGQCDDQVFRGTCEERCN